MRDNPYMIIHDGYFRYEIYTEEEDHKVLNWLNSLNLELGEMFLSMNGTEYYNLKIARGE